MKQRLGALALRPFTILRTRMLIGLKSDQGAATEQQIVSYGKIVVSDDAAAVGLTAFPNPSGISGDPDAGHHAVASRFLMTSSSGRPSGGTSPL